MIDVIKKIIGQRIRELRNAKGYSQEKFAQNCGLDRTYIAGVEQGKRNISLENLNKIAESLELSLGELCDTSIPIRHTIVLKVNGEIFLLQSKSELTSEIKDQIEIMCRYAFDEDEPELLESLGEGKSLDDLYDLSVYEIAGLFEKTIKSKLGIDVVFKAIDLEVAINSD